MRSNWANSNGNWAEVPKRDRDKFFGQIARITDTDCQEHGTTHLLRVGPAHYGLYSVGNKYYELVFVCDHQDNVVYFHRCQYCDKRTAQRMLGGDLELIGTITQTLQRLVA